MALLIAVNMVWDQSAPFVEMEGVQGVQEVQEVQEGINLWGGRQD